MLFTNYAFTKPVFLVSYTFEEPNNKIIAQLGLATTLSLEWGFNGEWCILDWEYDIRPLTKRYGEVSNHKMEWIKIWMNWEFEEIKCHVCNSYLLPILKGFVDSCS